MVIGNIHGLSSDTDTTMMQNSQWGAVAYLAQSDYGNKQTTEDDSGIWNNPYNEGYTHAANNEYGINGYATTLTGMAGSFRENYSNIYSKVLNKTKNSDGSITISYVNITTSGAEGSTYTNTYYHYDTENGQKASTTRNIYGIYDMSGGAWDYMANYLENGTRDYVNDFKTIDKKYQTSYAGTGETNSTEDRTANYEANKNKYGDALWEISNGANGQCSWNGDHSYFPYFDYSFFVRGGCFAHSKRAGIFYFSSAHGARGSIHSFRVVAF